MTEAQESGEFETLWYPVEAPDNGGPTAHVIMEGDPINGSRVRNAASLADAIEDCTIHNDHTSADALVEVVARALAMVGRTELGASPDDEVAPGVPLWKRYVYEAGAVVIALQEAGHFGSSETP